MFLKNAVIRILRILLGFVIFISKSFYAIILFLLTTFRENVTIILAVLTGAYVLLTLNIVRESKRQTDIMIENTRYVQRAFFYVDADLIVEHWPTEAYTAKSRLDSRLWSTVLARDPAREDYIPPYVLKCRIRTILKNGGRTPGFPITCSWIIDTFPEKLNVRDSICLERTIRNSIGSVIEFRDVIEPMCECSTSTSSFRYVPDRFDVGIDIISMHLYLIYRDIFDEYHDYYLTTNFWVDYDKKEISGSPTVSTYTFKEDERQVAEWIAEKQKKVRY